MARCVLASGTQYIHHASTNARRTLRSHNDPTQHRHHHLTWRLVACGCSRLLASFSDEADAHTLATAGDNAGSVFCNVFAGYIAQCSRSCRLLGWLCDWRRNSRGGESAACADGSLHDAAPDPPVDNGHEE